jgi:hypothetical protein
MNCLDIDGDSDHRLAAIRTVLKFRFHKRQAIS